jgi:type IV secretory pathway VirB6-like protein
LIHFNIATYLNNDGCTDQIVPNISLFNPYLLNTDNWVRTMIDFGAQYAVLVAKVKLVYLLNIYIFDNCSMHVVFLWLLQM